MLSQDLFVRKSKLLQKNPNRNVAFKINSPLLMPFYHIRPHAAKKTNLWQKSEALLDTAKNESSHVS